MLVDSITRHANYGLELVDAFTGDPLLGANEVVPTFVGPPPPTRVDATQFRIAGSRWIFEDLPGEVTFEIRAAHYLPRALETNVDLPAVPGSGVPGVLVRVELMPRTGYPFPLSTTRVVGAVRLDPGVDPARPLVPDATVTITPTHSVQPPNVVVPLNTRTADDGQYTMWFDPQLGAEPATADGFDVAAQATVEISGVPTPVSGSLNGVPLSADSLTLADDLLLTP